MPEQTVALPAAHYLIATSRLRPGLDGGYTVSTMHRARLLVEQAGVRAPLLTFDLAPDSQGFIDGFRELGLADEGTRLQTILEAVREHPEILREAAELAPAPADPQPQTGSPDPADLDATGTPWRILVRDADGAITHTDFLDAEGRPLFRLPYISGRADWWRAAVEVPVLAADGSELGRLDGFRGLYRAWMLHVVREAARADEAAGRARLPVVAIVEARQVGELVTGIPNLTIVHTVHSAHVGPPYTADAPMDASWAGWIDTIGEYDAVAWPTEHQRRDVHARFGEHVARSFVVPHPAQPAPGPELARDPLRAVMIARLAPGKRVDHAIRAWPAVLERHPDARLDVYGDGALRAELTELIQALRLVDRVTLHGHDPAAPEQLRTAAALVLTTLYEGQSLVLLEAAARGCPAVSYDAPYGPGETIQDGVTGRLVTSGDIAALAEALGDVLGDAEGIQRMSTAARAWADANGPEQTAARWAQLLEAVVPREAAAG
ncbi:glycosyltransferase [Microcella daejeonensis]|uniref:glycosyltransferase n=1 Tax=Microcella daejeonensis TaxID=2994971 RepID=UPI00226F0277|nr:glycosyltransferase [Microcella daejeonensis]WAB84422.1 glycosyltransferase [Microcella daejeonensis]